MTLHNLFADGQPNPRSWIFSAGMQPLEDAKDTLGMIRIETNTVIAHGKAPRLLVSSGRDMNVGALMAAKLNGIAEQVLKYEPELLCIGFDRRQQIVGDLHVALF